MLGSGCDIGENSILRGVLADKNCSVARGTEIGVNPDEDRKRFPIITEQGIVVLPKGTRGPKTGPLELARNMFELMEKDPGMSKTLRQLAVKPVAAGHLRHSYPSRGPQAHAPRTMTKGFVDE